MRRNFLLLLATTTLFAQAPQANPAAFKKEDYVPPARLPRVVQRYHQELGDRLQVPGKERAISIGTLTDSRGTASATIAWELPGRFRLDRPGNRSVQAGANGLAIASTQANLNEDEENLVDSLLQDRPETFLLHAAQGQYLRLIAQNVRATRDSSPNYFGPLYDVYDQIAKVDSRPNSPERLKRFFVDARTGLLFRVVYFVTRAGKSVQAETVFTQWTTVQGQATPNQIERRHDGVTVFTYRANSNTYAAFALDSTFERPQ